MTGSLRRIRYPLDEVLLLCLLAVLARAEAITDIARSGDKKLDLLRRFRPFREGVPAHDRLGDILASLDAEHSQRCFVAWVASLTGVPDGVVAIDGKTVRRSKGSRKSEEPIHMVSAFAARQRLVLGQVKVADKANEILASDFKDTTVSRACTIDGDHGRIETRNITVIHDIDWLQKSHQWPGLNSVVMVESAREASGKIERETRFNITSLVLVASLIGPLIRDHWAIENSLHWVLDMVFRDDECRLPPDYRSLGSRYCPQTAVAWLHSPLGPRVALYAAEAYRQVLADADLLGSMGRKGSPYDNARPKAS